MEENSVLEKRKEKIFSYFKKNTKWYWIVLIIIAWLGYFIRTRNLPLLHDVTTGRYIPGPEADTYVFLRYVEYIVQNGHLMAADCMRYFPWCYGGAYGGNMNEYSFLSYFIAYLYKFWHFFNSSITVQYAHVMYPVISFVIALVFFFLLVKKLFDYKIALLASAFLTLVPAYLHRTIAGFSDKESLGFIFMFAAFYFFVCAWQNEKIKKAIIFGALSGLSSGLMGLVWGGFSFVITTIGIFVLLEVLLNRIDEKNSYAYISWFLLLSFILIAFRGWTLGNLIGSMYTAIDCIAFVMIILNLAILKKDLLKIRERIDKKIPVGILNFLVTLVIGVLAMMIVFHPDFIIDRIRDIYVTLTNPFGTGRWAVTVAEAHQPYLVDWVGQMSWTYFWLFMAGSVLIFYNIIKIVEKNAWKPTLVYLLFLLGFTFSRYSPSSTVLNGETNTARFIYFGSLIMLGVFIIASYLYLFYKNKEKFNKIKEINDVAFFILVWFVIMIVGARSASRLILVFVPVTTILAAYLAVNAIEYSMKLKKDAYKIIAYLLIFFIVFSPFGSAVSAIPLVNKLPIINKDGMLVEFGRQTYLQAKYVGPGYNQQWQYAGKWIRENTPKDAVFAHWWDYGYLVQYGGERATMTDGGNAMGSLNYFMGRTVLTGQNETEALEFLKAHNATNLLMISDEIGKYPAFSSIGSDVNWDRYSWLQVFQIDKNNIQETRDETIYLYRGGAPLDEDFTYKGQLYPRGSSGIVGIFLPVKQDGNDSQIGQPTAVLVYNGQQIRIPLECVFINGREITFPEKGIVGCLRIIPVIQDNKVNPVDAGIYISPKVKRTLFTKLYLFGQDGKYFKTVYNDEQNMPLSLYNGRIIGPLKIWDISYPKDLVIPDMYYVDKLPDPRVESLEGRF